MCWIEFEGQDNHKVMVRDYNVVGVETASGPDRTTLILEIGDDGKLIDVKETYEQTKQKILDAEKVEYTPTVEHFTKEEYENLLECMKAWKRENQWHLDRKCDRDLINGITDKLKTIIKEWNA